ncbi:3-deoxy-D-manno-octulosonic acid transferase [Geoalkalibacter halelectricus]|uniref:3-deoxy-D-manno-octulosonic acid transferase n=1 Tax=Geoalkalibacter halelectricus TaxID=2847045 RepID=A0ABY5ZHU7_9BACT|nr:3-deoxy-D-manno-octulosonic acid transferase [Geoalkalibacter halelectricus]MDO3379570.1 3-deoxy-D-manno-octulosonic acid transferase [Geoalkalibacter halelectricus]UWZ78158.1 3-deoxy-D-manno-octulosonic acid transferase [Geoalkalibacter halelectricus]
MFLLYDLVLLASSLVLIPWYLLRKARYGTARRGLRERLGFFAPGRLAPTEKRPVIWVHAVSVGETRAAIPLLKALRQAYPEACLLVSNTTETGHSVARSLPEIDLCLFFPFDLSFVVRRVLNQVRPSLVVFVDTEIWPNFSRIAGKQGIPLVLANGRISDRSFPRYHMIRFALRPVLKNFSAFCMQSEQDAERIQAIGALPERVRVTGNLKFDLQAQMPSAEDVAALKSRFRISPGALVWVAGSTHAGEEEQVLDAYLQLVAQGRPVVLILVPRHPERCRQVSDVLAQRHISFALRSRVDEREEVLAPGEVLLVDSIGEMLKFYAMADLVFVGGSLVPVGGHNVLEGVLLKKAVLYGPHMHNFRDIAKLLREAGAAMEVADGQGLQQAVAHLIDHPLGRRALGEAGYQLIARNVGATAQTLSVIESLLEKAAEERK